MNLDRVHEHVANVKTMHQAAKLHNALNHELEHGNYSFEEAAPGERALSDLEDRFPGVADRAAEITEPPSLSRRAKENLDRSDRGRRGVDHAGRSRRSGQGPGARRPASSPPRSRAARARASAGAATGRAGQLVSAVDTGDWGELVGEMFLWGVGLSIFYLLITRAAAAGKLWLGATNAVRALVSPVVDPLKPKGAL